MRDWRTFALVLSVLAGALFFGEFLSHRLPDNGTPWALLPKLGANIIALALATTAFTLLLRHLVRSWGISDRLAKAYLFSELTTLWELFSFILPSNVRREAFEPAYNDLLEDYVRAGKFRSPWARRWLTFAFTVRTLIMVLDCFRVMLTSGTGKLLLGFLPESLRSWLRRQ